MELRQSILDESAYGLPTSRLPLDLWCCVYNKMHKETQKAAALRCWAGIQRDILSVHCANCRWTIHAIVRASDDCDCAMLQMAVMFYVLYVYWKCVFIFFKDKEARNIRRNCDKIQGHKRRMFFHGIIVNNPERTYTTAILFIATRSEYFAPGSCEP